MRMYRVDRESPTPAVEAEETKEHDFSWRVREERPA